MHRHKTYFIIGLIAILAIVTSDVYAQDMRTANRSVVPSSFLLGHLKAKRHSYNSLAIRQSHPAQWQGIEWDSAKWEDIGWSKEKTLSRFTHAKIFKKTFLRRKKPYLSVGKGFFELSELDQNRSLKLFADHSGIFENGFNQFFLYSSKHRKTIGEFGKRGLTLY